MKEVEEFKISPRRVFLNKGGLVLLLGGAGLPIMTSQKAFAQQAGAADCSIATPPAMMGPFFTPRSPLRNSLIERDTSGNRMTLSGRVLDADCRPVPGALLDFWQADGSGNYDNEGYRLRGHQFSDSNGAFLLETVVPGEYPGRTPHLHVRIKGGRGPVLTSQLYFPGHPKNGPDFLFDERLVMKGVGTDFEFDFVLRA